MNTHQISLIRSTLLLLLVGMTVVGCRGSDDIDTTALEFPTTDDPDAFGAFLNPLPGLPRDEVIAGEVNNVQDFPEAYYNTIDPDNTRDSFFKWRVENGFLNADGTEAPCDPATCRQTHVKFRDTKDLGYGRNMFLRWNTATNDVAVYVENFQVLVEGLPPYGLLNLNALIDNERQFNFGVNAIEFSAFPATDAGARKFTKFYNFAGDGARNNDVSGSQQHFVDLDGRGDKPMPTACIICHGGRGETLVYRSGDDTLKLAPTLIGGIPGDVQAHMQTIEFDTLEFVDDEPGFTREDNADGIRLINEAILSTYEYRKANFSGSGEWDADLAIDTLKGRYAGDPGNPDNAYNENFVPSGWSADENLYKILGAPNCLVCHALRGTQINNTVSFNTLGNLQNYSARIDHLIYEQGKMPLGLLNYSDFWDSDDKDPATMAAALGLPDKIDVNQRAIRPGAPVAQISAPPVATGIDASGATLDIAITGSGSAFSTMDGHRWEVSPPTATVTPTGVSGDAMLRASAEGTHTLTLTVDGMNGGTDSTTQTVRVVSTDNEEAPTPPGDVSYFGAGGINELMIDKCIECHAPDRGFSSLPIHYTACRSDEFNGNEFLYRSVLARINFFSPLDSLFLRKPTNGSTDPVDRTNTQIIGYHQGGYVLEEDADYSKILSWILNGAPSGPIPDTSTISADAPLCTPNQ